jgi:hypothetical protein
MVSNTWTGKTLLNLAKMGTTKHLVQNARHYFPIDPNTSHLLRQFQKLCHTTAYYFMQRRRERFLRAGVTLAPDDREVQELMRISDEFLNKHEGLFNISNLYNPTLESTITRVSDKILESSVLSVSDPIQISSVTSVSDQNLKSNVLSVSNPNQISSVINVSNQKLESSVLIVSDSI